MTIAEQLIEEGRQQGRAEARQQGLQEGRIATLRLLLVVKFKLQALDPSYETRLQVATPEAFDRYLRRALIADSLAAVFAD
jgi:hypothetical protein